MTIANNNEGVVYEVLEKFKEQYEYMQERVNSGIEEYRKGDFTIAIKNADGKTPVRTTSLFSRSFLGGGSSFNSGFLGLGLFCFGFFLLGSSFTGLGKRCDYIGAHCFHGIKQSLAFQRLACFIS